MTKKEKNDLLKLIKSIDVKELEIDIDDESYEKWFRFGSYNGLRLACEIITKFQEKS